jgi:hypothetical protein
MKFSVIKMLAFVALVSIGNSALGYTWIFNNYTKRIIMVAMKLQAKGNARFWYLLSPNRKHDFSWGFAYCYSSLELTEFNKMEAMKEDPKLGNLKVDAEYGDNSPDYVKNYFDNKIWQIPSVFYPKSSVDSSKIASALKQITDSGTQIAGKVIAGKKSQAAGAGGAAGTSGGMSGGMGGAGTSGGMSGGMGGAGTSGGMSGGMGGGTELTGLGDAVGGIAGLIADSIATSRCASRIFDIYEAMVVNPATQEKQAEFVLLAREN